MLTDHAEAGAYYADHDVLVTGGYGFVGAHLVRHLLLLGARVTVLDNDCRPERPSQLTELRSGSGPTLRVIDGDVTRYEDLRTVLLGRDFRAVFHLAAYSVIERAARHPMDAISTNTMGTVNLLEVLRRYEAARPDALVLSSTDKVYGEMDGDRYTEQSPLRGIGPYDAAKLAGDVFAQTYSQSFGIATVVLRLCNVFGPHDYNDRYRLVPRCLARIFDPAGPRPPELYFEAMQHRRDYLYIDDVVDALLLAGRVPTCRGDVFNIAGCANLATPEVMCRLVELAAEHEATFDQDRAARISGNGFRVAVRGPAGATAITRQHVDGTKFTQRTGFRARTPFDTGLRAAVEFARRRMCTMVDPAPVAGVVA
jgi:nucleoside-diphosphate-sugar epimerase